MRGIAKLSKPGDPSHSSPTDGLGEPEGTFPIHPACEVVGWLGYILTLCLTAWFGVLAIKPYGENPPPTFVAMGMCVFWGLGSIGCLVGVLKLRSFYMVVFRDALVKKQGQEATVIPWHSITKVELPGSAFSQLRIHSQGQQPLDIHAAIRNVRELGRLIEQHVPPETIEFPELALLVSNTDNAALTANGNAEAEEKLPPSSPVLQSTLSHKNSLPQPVAATSHTITDWSTLPSYGENPLVVPIKSPFLSRTMAGVLIAGFFMANLLFMVFAHMSSQRPALPPNAQFNEVNAAIRASQVR
jgi:hypothetical protein